MIEKEGGSSNYRGGVDLHIPKIFCTLLRRKISVGELLESA